MKFPKKVYEAEFTSYGISYFPRKDSKEESLVSIDFPKWLMNLLEESNSHFQMLGYERAKKEIRVSLGLS